VQRSGDHSNAAVTSGCSMTNPTSTTVTLSPTLSATTPKNTSTATSTSTITATSTVSSFTFTGTSTATTTASSTCSTTETATAVTRTQYHRLQPQRHTCRRIPLRKGDRGCSTWPRAVRHAPRHPALLCESRSVTMSGSPPTVLPATTRWRRSTTQSSCWTALNGALLQLPATNAAECVEVVHELTLASTRIPLAFLTGAPEPPLSARRRPRQPTARARLRAPCDVGRQEVRAALPSLLKRALAPHHSKKTIVILGRGLTTCGCAVPLESNKRCRCGFLLMSAPKLSLIKLIMMNPQISNQEEKTKKITDKHFFFLFHFFGRRRMP
jgi:hypothetical protein